MGLAFLLFFPIGIITARYYRSTFTARHWFKVTTIKHSVIKCTVEHQSSTGQQSLKNRSDKEKVRIRKDSTI